MNSLRIEENNFANMLDYNVIIFVCSSLLCHKETKVKELYLPYLGPILYLVVDVNKYLHFFISVCVYFYFV